MNVYSIKDIKSNIFNTPFFKNHNIQAIRDFNSICNDNQSILFKYPQDFELWKIGEFNEETGEFKKDLNFLLSGIFQKETEINDVLTKGKNNELPFPSKS